MTGLCANQSSLVVDYLYSKRQCNIRKMVSRETRVRSLALLMIRCRSRLSTDTIESAHTNDAPVVDQPSTSPIAPTPVNDASPIANDPVPAGTIDPPVAPIKAVRVSKPKPATLPSNDPTIIS